MTIMSNTFRSFMPSKPLKPTSHTKYVRCGKLNTDMKEEIVHMFSPEELNRFLSTDLPEVKKQLLLLYIISKQECLSCSVSLTCDNIKYTLTDELL